MAALLNFESLVKLYCSVTPAEGNSLKAEIANLSEHRLSRQWPPAIMKDCASECRRVLCERLYWEVIAKTA